MPYIGQRPSKGDENNFKILDDISSYTLTFDGSDAAVVSAANDTITSLTHRFVQGQRVTYHNGGGSDIGGLSGTAYFIIKEDHNTIKLASSASNASNGVAVNITGVGGGSSHRLSLAFDGTNTKFKATHTNGQKAKITRAAQLVISMNGVIQQPHDTATPSTGFGFDLDGTIVFSQAPVSTDVFWAHVLTNNNVTFDISDNDIDNFTGNGSTVSFNLSKSPPDNRNVLVTLDGVVQYPNDPDGTARSYNVVENVLTFTSAPASGVEIQVRHIGFAGSTSGGGGGVTNFYGRTGSVVLKSTDNIVANNATFSGDLTVNGTTTTLDTQLVEVDKIEVETTSTNVAIAVTHNGTGDLIRLYDGATQKVTVDANGNVSIAGVTTVAGSIVQTSGHTQLRSFSNPTSGAGMELGYDGTRAIIQPYDRDNSVSKNLYIAANVGINQLNPTAKLDVAGDVKVSGTLDANGDLDVDGHTELDNVSVAGVTTFSDDVKLTVSNGHGILLDKSTSQFNINSGTTVRFQNNNEVNTDDGKIGTALFASGLNIVGSQTGSGLGRQIRLYGNLLTDNIRPTADSSHSIGTSSNRFLHAYLDNLDVDGHTNLDNVSIAGVTTVTGTGGNGLFKVERASGAGLHIQAQSALGVFGTTSNHNLRLISNGNERILLSTNGNVGIGSAIPAAKLDVVGSLKADGTVTIDNSASPTIQLTSNSTTGSCRLFFGDPDSNLVGRLSYVHNGDYFSFYAAYGERFRIAGNGDITVTSIDANATGPTLKLFHNSGSPAATDVISRISMVGDDAAGNETVYSRIETVIDDPTNGQETAHIQFATRGASAFNQILRIKNRGTSSAPNYTADDINGIILDVYNTGNPYPRYMNFIAKSAGNTDSNIGFWTEAVGGSPTEKLRITSDGKVGINSTTPEFEFDVLPPNNVLNNTLCVKGRGSGYAQLRLEGEGGASENYLTSSTTPLAFYVGSGGQKAKLQTNGMFLIGAGGADQYLHIKQSATTTYAKIENTGSSSNYTGINLRTPTLNFQIWNQGPGAAGAGYGGANSVNFWTAAAAPYTFHHGNTERLRIDTSGSVGIGITNPQALTHIYDSTDTSSITEQLRISGGDRTSDSYETGIRFYTQSPSTNGNRHYRITANGNTGLIIQGHETSSGNAAVDRNIFLNPSGGDVIVGGTSFGAAGTFSIDASGHVRSVLASGNAGDTLLGGISGVSNGFQISIDSSNNQEYKFHNGSQQNLTLNSSGTLIGANSYNYVYPGNYANSANKARFMAPVNYASGIYWGGGNGSAVASLGSANDTNTGGNYSSSGGSENNLGYVDGWGLIPFGGTWRAQNNDAGSNFDGGWSKYITNLPGDDWTYMSTILVRRVGSETSGQFYHGCDWDNTLYQNGTAQTNPYFQSFGISTLPQDVWCLSIGFITGNGGGDNGTAGANTAVGVFRLDTGAKIVNGNWFRMKDGSTQQVHRTYLYYSTNSNAHLQWRESGFYVCDGSEPSISQLSHGRLCFKAGTGIVPVEDA